MSNYLQLPHKISTKDSTFKCQITHRSQNDVYVQSQPFIYVLRCIQEASDALEDSDVDEVAEVAPRARAPRAAAAKKVAIIELSSSEDEKAADSEDDSDFE